MVHFATSTLDPVACSRERSMETTELLQAAQVLHRDGMLTRDEYEAKRRSLSARL